MKKIEELEKTRIRLIEKYSIMIELIKSHIEYHRKKLNKKLSTEKRKKYKRLLKKKKELLKHYENLLKKKKNEKFERKRNYKPKSKIRSKDEYLLILKKYLYKNKDKWYNISQLMHNNHLGNWRTTLESMSQLNYEGYAKRNKKWWKISDKVIKKVEEAKKSKSSKQQDKNKVKKLL